MNKVIKILVVIIIFSSILNAEIPLSKRYGEYYDKAGRKLTIDKYGYGVFEDKGIKSERFQIGKSYSNSEETNYRFTLIIRGAAYANNYLYFIDKENCVLVRNGYIKYYFSKDGHLKYYYLFYKDSQ